MSDNTSLAVRLKRHFNDKDILMDEMVDALMQPGSIYWGHIQSLYDGIALDNHEYHFDFESRDDCDFFLDGLALIGFDVELEYIEQESRRDKDVWMIVFRIHWGE